MLWPDKETQDGKPVFNRRKRNIEGPVTAKGAIKSAALVAMIVC